MKKTLKTDDFKKILSTRKVRTELAYRSHYWCFHTYFAHYVKYETAPFQKELFEITEDDNNKMAVIVSFRGSAKSTIMSLSYPIWAILGVQQKKFVLIASQTQQQAKLMISNIRQELEQNALLRADLGPFKEESNEWGSSTLYLPKYKARIAAVSAETSIRGFRNMENRPDLIIVDDAEDLNSTKTKEGRAKTYQWFMGDLVPTGDFDTKAIVIGNLLHEDSLLMRLKDKIERNELEGIFKSYPLVDDSGQSLWPGHFPDMDTVERRRKKLGDERSWQREFLLRIIPAEDQIVLREWIHHYDKLPEGNHYHLCYIATGADLAISERESADNTALVSGALYDVDGEPVLYILPNPINAHMSFRKTIETMKSLSFSLGGGYSTKILVESVGYQDANVQQLVSEGVNAEPVRIGALDKRSRLSLSSYKISVGKIMFPKYGCDELISNIVHFGVEKHDDLADAFSLLVNYCFANHKVPFNVETDLAFV